MSPTTKHRRPRFVQVSRDEYEDRLTTEKRRKVRKHTGQMPPMLRGFYLPKAQP